jgi:hypothetical protein
MSFLQVASWNIEHLSGASRKDKRQSVYALADHIEMAGIDVIALQEVYVTDPDEELRLFENQPVIESRATSERRNADLDATCYLLEEHLDVRWEYLILPNRSDGDKSQLCALMWNTTRVQPTAVKRLAVEHSIDGDALWDRAPHAVTFTSPLQVWRKTPDGEWHRVEEHKSLTIVPIHMKSNYGGGTKNIRKRENEARTLVDALRAAADELDPSLILIGDTNVLKYDEPAIEAFVENGFIDLNNTDSPTYWSRQYGDSPFDRAFIAEGRPEFKYTRQYVLRSADLVLHDRFLSDHYMIKISVKIYLDDTDPRSAVTG